MRLMKALSLLRDPELRVFNVAKECGFNRLNHFTTCFKKRFGKTPGEWRKEGAQPEGNRASFNLADHEFYQGL